VRHLIDERPLKNGLYLDSSYGLHRRRRPRWPIPWDAMVAIVLVAGGVVLLIWRPWW
jgi:hypothetical protein